ncbi:MAG: 4-hydroxy-tetrahydrodipicolinate synthase [Thermoanaerobaculia bacterium]|jgi:4-hydroxy-tetrahydrodipicolinate synthase|nr:4-hydroxy-tetrahydrodipicolinate synthase [Thermoanaerobaculia bacterium]
MTFRGLGTALITPFTESGALDESALARFVDFQIDGGVNFLVPCGTTGENPALTADEHRRVVEIVVRRANGRVAVLAGAGSNNTARAIELADQAIDIGAEGVLTITPYYNKPTPDGLRRHFGMQAEAINKKKTGFPMIMYNVPGRTGVNMTAETTLRMAAEIPNIVGVKEASANLEQIMTVIRDRAEGFLVLSGDDAWTLPLIGAGADGLVSVASNEIPRLMSDLVGAALRGDFVAARAIHYRILPLLTGNFIESNPIPVKTACKLLGIIESDAVRPPLAPITSANREKLIAILRECGLMEKALVS